MVMRKKIEYRSNGFQVHSIPRAPRSFRRRSPQKKTVEENQICAFELLASLAGKLLQESETSSTSSNASERKAQPVAGTYVIKQEQEEEVKPVKEEHIEQATGERVVLASQDSKVEVASPDYAESCIVDTGNAIGRKQKAEGEGPGDMTMARACSLKVPVDLCEKLPDLVNSNSDAQPPLCMDTAPGSYFALHRSNVVSLGNRDDDETFSRYIKPPSKGKSYRPPSRIGDRRIRKLLTSKYWKVAPKLKDCEMSRTDGGNGMRPVYRKRKTFYHRERYQHDMLYKRRRMYDQSSTLTSNCGFSSESVSNSPEKLMNGEKNNSTTTYHGASSKVIGHQMPFRPKDSHVKLSINSFKVPELFIEVPETTTVGSLKRIVMEAVTAILGDELHVGVVLQGKKVRDDNRTLLQTGISCKDNLDSLGFTLEPTVVQAHAPICSETPSLPSLCDAPPTATRFLPATELDIEVSGALPDSKTSATLEDQLESNHETILTDNSMSDSRALVPVPAMTMEAPLAAIPLNQKPRRSELVQRRTRRPFSVAEVEALVEAVEQHGTGRWRDVKLRSFEDADHRTYVDLKDKWKTLVHTAQIAPQQRRGEPVPQELLDRVLAAHGYWSQRQAEKNQGGVEKMTEAGWAADRVGAENESPSV